VRAAVPDGKTVDAMISSTVKRRTSMPLNGTEHEVCALSVCCLSLSWHIFTSL
jgi:vacuolar protein sorting-associated protein 54